MDFELSEQQNMLKTMARDFLSVECNKVKVRDLEESDTNYDPKMWSKMAELGWLGLIFPEQYGGTGADLLDLVILMEEMGRNITPGPFFATVALCAIPIMKFGNKRQQANYLTSIAEGKSIWSLAIEERHGGYEASHINCSADYDGKHFVINGEKMFVPYAHIADYFLVVCNTGKDAGGDGGLTTFIVKAKSRGVKIEKISTFAGDGQCRVRFRNVKVSRSDVLGRINSGRKVLDMIMQWGTVLKCAEVSGACQAVLEMTNNYAKERIQFDKPIGSLMVIQHQLVDMFTDIEGLQYLVYYAAWLLTQGVKADVQISIAKAKANKVYQRACIDGVKIHGAIGFTMDHDLGCYFRRIKTAEFMLGDTSLHLEKIASGLGL
ncbi:MAG: acyl-CoA/acyl-ACP dehydrogenase [Dehalococcoidia bacterium]|nr:acyl-CoA/acyl-ACP dehydrogenase [Dehalococcoidia bacterium]MDD5494733.1 acyl-CoA/acyl-ACP dehydrogenase [Dehalococcoidia bacterium]